MNWLRRWKVATRTTRNGQYTARTFFTRRAASKFAHDYNERGLGAASRPVRR